MSTTEVSYFRSETADVNLLENREIYPLDTQEQIGVYNAKIIEIIDIINARPVPRLEGYPIGDMPEAYKDKAKTLILRLYKMYKHIEGADNNNHMIKNKLFAFNTKYKANLENHFDWWVDHFGPKTIERSYGTYRRYGGKKRTYKRKTHVNKSRKNKKKIGNK